MKLKNEAAGSAKRSLCLPSKRRALASAERDDFILASADDSLASQRSTILGDDGALTFVTVALEVDHHPVAHATKLVGSIGVGVESREVPVVLVAVKNRQPGATVGVVSLRRDSRELTRFGLLSIVAIDIEQ